MYLAMIPSSKRQQRFWARLTGRWVACALELYTEHKGVRPVHYYLHQTKRGYRMIADTGRCFR